MSPWPAALKPSNTLRECSVICVESALENIGWNGGPAIRLNGATIQIHAQSLFRFCNSSSLQVVRLHCRFPQVRRYMPDSSAFEFAPLCAVDPSDVVAEAGFSPCGFA